MILPFGSFFKIILKKIEISNIIKLEEKKIKKKNYGKGHKMKKFLKKASIYLLIMIAVAAIFIGLNYYYGSKLAEDLQTNIQKAAEENNYQIRSLTLNANPLFQEVNIERLMLNRPQELNLDIVDAEIKLSWQQIFHYIRNGELALNKNYRANIKSLNYSDIVNDYRLNFKDALLIYNGEYNLEDAKNIKYLLDHNHNFNFQAEKLIYDYPYYRSYGITAESWEKLSTFTDVKLKANYQSKNNILKVEELVLSGEFINYEADLKAEIRDYAEIVEDSGDQLKNELVFNSFKLNYLLDFNGEGLKTEQNQYYQSLSFDNYSFKAYLDIFLDNPDRMLYRANQFDAEMKLSNFNLIFNEELSREINENTFGIFAKNDQFSLKINSFDYNQEYINPAGETESTIITPFVDSELDANYTYSKEEFYLDNALLKVKPKTVEAETLFNFIQLIFDQQFEQDEDNYYLIKIHGGLGNLEFN